MFCIFVNVVVLESVYQSDPEFHGQGKNTDSMLQINGNLGELQFAGPPCCRQIWDPYVLTLALKKQI